MRINSKLSSLLLFGVLTLLAADDPFVGTWKLNLAKSKFQGEAPPQSETVAIDAGGKVTVSGTDSKGQAVNWSYTATSGGAATITGIPDASVTEVRKESVVDHTWKFGSGAMKGHGVVSKNGKTMTYTIEGTDSEGKKIKSTEVYEKQ